MQRAAVGPEGARQRPAYPGAEARERAGVRVGGQGRLRGGRGGPGGDGELGKDFAHRDGGHRARCDAGHEVGEGGGGAGRVDGDERRGVSAR